MLCGYVAIIIIKTALLFIAGFHSDSCAARIPSVRCLFVQRPTGKESVKSPKRTLCACFELRHDSFRGGGETRTK